MTSSGVNKILIVGLGNPGRQYKNTPHNIGYETISELIARISNDEFRISKDEKSYAALWKTNINENEAIFVKPLLYMNRSGSALQKIITDYGLRITDYGLWVVHDDADLPLGLMRRSYGSSSGGHKGVQNIIERIGTKDFHRFRVGIRTEELSPADRRESMKKVVTKKIGRKNKENFKKTAGACADIIYEELKSPQLDHSTKNYEVL